MVSGAVVLPSAQATQRQRGGCPGLNPEPTVLLMVIVALHQQLLPSLSPASTGFSLPCFGGIYEQKGIKKILKINPRPSIDELDGAQPETVGFLPLGLLVFRGERRALRSGSFVLFPAAAL